MSSAKLVTADVVEILDSHTFASHNHIPTAVSSGDAWDVVLSKIESVILTLNQKASFDNALSSPSDTNFVVLKDALESLYAGSDLGEIKDSVMFYADLPLTGNTVGDMRPVINDRILYMWNGTTWIPLVKTGTLDHTQLTNQDGDSNHLHLTLPDKMTILGQDHEHTNLPELTQIWDSGSGVIISAEERSRIMSDNETSAIQFSINLLPENFDPITDVITYIGHGFVDGDTVQAYCSNGILPPNLVGPPTVYEIVNATPDTFKLIVSGIGSPVDIISQGTRAVRLLKYGELSPSSFNRLVTNFDPRLNTIRNPYITFGPTGATSPPPSFFGTATSDLVGSMTKEGALPAMIEPTGTARVVKSLEILPGETTSPSSPEPYLLSYTDLSTDNIQLAPDTTKTIVPSSIDITTDTISMVGHPFMVGDIVTLTSTSALPSYIVTTTTSLGPVYSVQQMQVGECFGIAYPTANAFQLTRLGSVDAGVPIPIDITSGGAGVHTITQLNALFLDVLSLRNATFRLATESPAIVIEDATGAVTIRGLVIETQGSGTSGISILRKGVLLEDCWIKPAQGEPLSSGQEGITVTGNDTTLRRCQFSGNLTKAITIVGNCCRVEECSFNLSNPASIAIDVLGNDCQIDHSMFRKGTVIIESSAQNCQISSNMWPVLSDVSIQDSGVNTRILRNLPEEQNQPIFGRTKTLGMVGSFADYRGNDETPFIQALADPLCDELLVFSGTYTLNNPVVIPEGKVVKAAVTTRPTINVVTSGFGLSPYSAISRLSFVGQNNLVFTSTSATDATISYCNFNSTLSTAATLTGDGISVSRSTFTGTQGLVLTDCTKFRVIDCVFQTALNPISGSIAGASYGRFEGNIFMGSTPTLVGDSSIIRGNHFLGTIPNKTSSAASVWWANYPESTTNNAVPNSPPAGVDQVKIQLESALTPLQATGAARDVASDIACIAFVKGGEGCAITLPLDIGATLLESNTYFATISWTSPIFSGTVVWEMTCVFRDRTTGTYGTPVVDIVTSDRTKLSPRGEELAVVPFMANSFGGIANPTHVSVKIRRLSQDALDTLHGTVNLIGADLTIYRI